MPGGPINATTRVDDWSFQENYVERLMDNAAFTAAHPNNTLVLAGPARKPKTGAGSGASFADVMKPIGMLQQMQVGHQRPVQPMLAIGSGRNFFLAGKGQVTFNIARLMVNGRNLLRVLYTQAVQNGLNVTAFGDPPVATANSEQTWLNMDSELFYIPFGLAVLFRSVMNDTVGAFYLELCMLNSWSTNFAAGQNAIMENTSGMADRLRPIAPSEFAGISAPEVRSTSSVITTDMGFGDPVPAGLTDF
jgi:hypothetical protein